MLALSELGLLVRGAARPVRSGPPTDRYPLGNDARPPTRHAPTNGSPGPDFVPALKVPLALGGDSRGDAL